MTTTETTTEAPGHALHQRRNGLDFAVADLGLAEFGRKEIRFEQPLRIFSPR
jgi:adenosylhomocysteinase